MVVLKLIIPLITKTLCGPSTAHLLLLVSILVCQLWRGPIKLRLGDRHHLQTSGKVLHVSRHRRKAGCWGCHNFWKGPITTFCLDCTPITMWCTLYILPFWHHLVVSFELELCSTHLNEGHFFSCYVFLHPFHCMQYNIVRDPSWSMPPSSISEEQGHPWNSGNKSKKVHIQSCYKPHKWMSPLVLHECVSLQNLNNGWSIEQLHV